MTDYFLDASALIKRYLVEQGTRWTVSLTDSAPKQRTTREILEAAGHLRPLGPTLERMIISGVTLEEVQDALSQAGGPSLSEIIDEQRGSKG